MIIRAKIIVYPLWFFIKRATNEKNSENNTPYEVMK